MSGSLAILTDTTRCNGCEECVVACKKANGLGEDRLWRGSGAIDELSPTRYTTVIRRPGGRYIRQQCRHCLEPACVSACIVGALRKTPEGAVVYDKDKCIGCRYCMLVCPYGIPRYEWGQPVPYVQKCTLCYEKLKEGEPPACVASCPEKATIFGPRSKLLAEAHRRLAANPGKYAQKVYGEHEFGGTSVLYVSDIPLDFLGWQTNPGERPLPDLTWAAQKEVPAVAVAGFGLLGGVYWVIGRRMKAGARSIRVSEPSGWPSTLKAVVWAPVGIAAAVTVAHLSGGLGGISNLGDAAAWTLWTASIAAVGVGIGGGIWRFSDCLRRKKTSKGAAERSVANGGTKEQQVDDVPQKD